MCTGIREVSIWACLASASEHGYEATNRVSCFLLQLDMLTRGQLGALSTFGKRYCVPTPSVHGYGTDYKGSANEAELHAVLEVRRFES